MHSYTSWLKLVVKAVELKHKKVCKKKNNKKGLQFTVYNSFIEMFTCINQYACLSLVHKNLTPIASQ